MCNKLFKVTLQGSRFDDFYVVAADANLAYETVKKDLDRRDIGFSSDRGLDSINLIAEDSIRPFCKARLYLTDN